jgi:hypothetical protein
MMVELILTETPTDTPQVRRACFDTEFSSLVAAVISLPAVHEYA